MAMTTTYSFDMDYDYLFKFIIVGDASTGKTSLISRYTQDVFPDSTVETVGVDFFFHQIKLDGEHLKIQVWDTAGQERFQSIIRSYYRGSHAVIYTYDVTDPESLENISRRWMKDTKSHIADGTLKILLANKADHPRAIPDLIDQGRALAHDSDIPFYVVSAKTAHNVNRAFESLALDCLDAVRANRLAVRRKRHNTGLANLKKPLPVKDKQSRGGIFSGAWCSLL